MYRYPIVEEEGRIFGARWELKCVSNEIYTDFSIVSRCLAQRRFLDHYLHTCQVLVRTTYRPYSRPPMRDQGSIPVILPSSPFFLSQNFRIRDECFQNFCSFKCIYTTKIFATSKGREGKKYIISVCNEPAASQ